MIDAVLIVLKTYVLILMFFVCAAAILFALMGVVEAVMGILWLHGMALWYGPKWCWKKWKNRNVVIEQPQVSERREWCEQMETFEEWMESVGDTVIDEEKR